MTGRRHSLGDLLLAAIVATGFTLSLNAGTISTLLAGRGVTLAQLGVQQGSVDEAYYFALVREAAEGHVRLGNASLREHRDAPTLGSYAPLLQGGIMRFFGWSVTTVVIVGDLLFPWIAALLICAVALSLHPSRAVALSVAVAVAAYLDGGLLRSVTPQVTFLVFLSYLLTLLGRWRRTALHYLLRGLLVGLMLFTHVLHALYAVVVEVCDAVQRARRGKTTVAVSLRNAAVVSVPVILAVCAKILLTVGADPVALVDTSRRLGVIPSRYPTSPELQVLFLIVGAFLLRLRRRRAPLTAETLNLLLILLVSALFVLNQSLLHGRDAIFGLYYRTLLGTVLLLSSSVAVALLCRSSRTVLLLVGSVAVLLTVGLGRNISSSIVPWDRSAEADSSVWSVLTWLRDQGGERVVLAPLPIADLVPIVTSHYVAFNRYARFQYASDRELAERYLLQESVFPTPVEDRDPTYNTVFGLYAGNLAARSRTACRLLSLFRKSTEECRVPIRSAIVHQELLPLLDRTVADRSELLRAFRVDLLITQGDLPRDLVGLCRRSLAIGAYTVYECSDRFVTMAKKDDAP